MKKLLIYMVCMMAMIQLMAGCTGCKESEEDPAGQFRATVNGDDVALYRLEADGEIQAEITNFGARIVALRVPDKNGVRRDVVLGFDSIQPYIRTANNFGSAGFPDRVWRVEEVSDSSITMTYECTQNNEDGNLRANVTYTVCDDNALRIDYAAESDVPTDVDLTNYSYFNLSGDPANSIDTEWLMINADCYLPVDSLSVPTGQIAKVDRTPFDFRRMKPIGTHIGSRNSQLCNCDGGYDHNMVLNTAGDISREAARLYDVGSGIVMHVFTTEPGIRFYTGNVLDGSLRGKHGTPYGKRSAICLRTLHFPARAGQEGLPVARINPGETYNSRTIYKFDIY